MFVDKLAFLELSTTSVVTSVVPSSRNLRGSSDESSGVESRLHPDVWLCFHWAHRWCTDAQLFVLVSDAIKEYRGLVDMLAETKTLMVALAYAGKWKRSVVAVRKGRLISSKGHSSGKERSWKLQDEQPCVSWPSPDTHSAAGFSTEDQQKDALQEPCWFLARPLVGEFKTEQRKTWPPFLKRTIKSLVQKNRFWFELQQRFLYIKNRRNKNSLFLCVDTILVV